MGGTARNRALRHALTETDYGFGLSRSMKTRCVSDQGSALPSKFSDTKSTAIFDFILLSSAKGHIGHLLNQGRCIVIENAEIAEAVAIDYVQLTAEVVSAYVSKNPVRPADMADLIASTHAALAGLGQGSVSKVPASQKLTSAQIRKSVTPDALISFIDGKPYKTLKRHLTGNGLTFDEYRARYGLPRDYPSTAPSYSAQRSALAKSSGLGQQRRKAAPKAAEVAEIISDKSKRAGRPRKANVAPDA